MPEDKQKAVSLVREAATAGLTKAQAVILRLQKALGVPASMKDLEMNWLSMAAKAGSTIALTDLRKLDLESYHHVMMDKKSSFIFQASIEERFREAVRLGELEATQELVKLIDDINWKDESGATCLYWVSMCLEESAGAVATLLLKNGAHVNISTEWIPGSTRAGHLFRHLDEVPPRTTPVEWAIMQDNLPVMEILMEASNNVDSTFLDDAMENHPIGCASRYQSQRCLNELCANNSPQKIRSFDGYGFSAFYYALRADALDRMLRFPVDQSMDTEAPLPVTPVVQREIAFLTTLLDHGSRMAVHKDDTFSCLHIAAAASNPEVFRFLLNHPKYADLPSGLLTHRSDDEYTPLKVAIARGNREIFTAILDQIKDPSDLWCDTRFHAIHLCSMRSKPQNISFAEMLLKKDPLCLRITSKSGSLSALHIAAMQGNRAMINFLVLRGADLLQPASRLTPLGSAIRARSWVGVDALGLQHQKQQIRQVAAHGAYRYLLPPIGQPVEAVRTVTATTFLLAPGIYSQNFIGTVDMSNVPFQKDSYLGCYDHPFSDVSRKILDTILCHYLPDRNLVSLRLWRHPVWILSRIIPGGPNAAAGIHLIHRVISAMCFHEQGLDAGLMWAIRMGNLEAIRLILDSRPHCQYEPSLRGSVELGYLQMKLGEQHVASEEDRIDVLKHLLRTQKEEYSSIKRKRQRHMVWGWYWRAYYSSYGDREQRCFEGCHQLELENRPFFIVGPWCRPRIPLYLLSLSVLWAILIPMSRYLSLLRHNSVIDVTSRHVFTLVGVAIIVCRRLVSKYMETKC